MDSETLERLGGVLVTLIFIGYGAVQARLGRQRAEVAVGHAEKAVQQTKSTGNGFAQHTTEALARIERQAAETHRLMIEHLADHAGSDLTRR